MPEVQVVGTVSKIEEGKNGWYRVNIAVPGSNYPKTADTKLEELIDKAREVRDAGSVATFTINETEQTDRETGEPKINPHNGRPYMNRWLNSIEDGDTRPAGAAQVSQVAAAQAYVQANRGDQGDVDWDGKERRDYRSRSWAHTISAFQHTIKTDEDPLHVFARLAPFQKMVYNDITGSFGREAEEEQPTSAGSTALSPADDEIPF